MSKNVRDNLVGALIGAVLGVIVSVYALNHLETTPAVIKADVTVEHKGPTNAEQASVEVVTVDVVAETEPMTEPHTEAEPTLYDIPLSDDLQIYITDLCEEANISPLLVFAIIEQESHYNADVIGDNCNSYGLMQIQAKWQQERMNKLGCTDLLNPYENVKIGIDILTELFSENSDWYWVLMAYNGGCSYANNRIEQGILTSDYADAVLEKVSKFKRKGV